MGLIVRCACVCCVGGCAQVEKGEKKHKEKKEGEGKWEEGGGRKMSAQPYQAIPTPSFFQDKLIEQSSSHLDRKDRIGECPAMKEGRQLLFGVTVARLFP